MSLSLSHFPLFLMSLSLSHQGVFLVTTTNAIISVENVFSMNTYNIHEFLLSHKGLSVVSEQACEWREQGKLAWQSAAEQVSIMHGGASK